MASAYPIPEDQGSVILLWAGEDPALHSTLLEQLKSAGIRYSDKTMGDDEVAPTADPLPIDWKPRFGFEVAVLSGDLTAAQAILERLLSEEPADLEIPAQDEVSAAEPALVSTTELRPTVVVWSGADDRIAQFLTAALQENEIPIHLEVAAELTNVLVSAANEARAREIVREVVNASPPE
jgi:NADPH-dependent ferric siderophore reductase